MPDINASQMFALHSELGLSPDPADYDVERSQVQIDPAPLSHALSIVAQLVLGIENYNAAHSRWQKTREIPDEPRPALHLLPNLPLHGVNPRQSTTMPQPPYLYFADIQPRGVATAHAERVLFPVLRFDADKTTQCRLSIEDVLRPCDQETTQKDQKRLGSSTITTVATHISRDGEISMIDAIVTTAGKLRDPSAYALTIVTKCLFVPADRQTA